MVVLPTRQNVVGTRRVPFTPTPNRPPSTKNGTRRVPTTLPAADECPPDGSKPMDHDNVFPDEAKTVADLLLTFMRQLNAGLADPAVHLPLGQLRVCGRSVADRCPCRPSAANSAPR